ncbi:MAG: PqqD family protein [Alphaproteobacteria bacterium]|nr:PqqD family protein [Alphaproteobacteria bacterium]
MPDDILIRFERVRQPVVLADCAPVLPIIDRVLAAWPHVVESGGPERLAPQAHRITLARTASLYLLDSPWLDRLIRHRDPLNAVCDLVVHLVHGFVATNPTALCLHSAAARIGGRLVVFPNVYRGGKSLLSAHLAALGAEIFADDVIPVRGRANHGFALGLAPRLRLPFPDVVEPEFETFVARHAGPVSARYRYLDLGPGRQAPFGATAPIGAFVLLDRREDHAAALEPLARGETLRRVIARNFARRQPARRILDRLQRVVEGTPCYRLAYGDPATAARLLMARFSEWDAARPEARRRAKTRARDVGRGGGPSDAWGRGGAWRLGSAVMERRVDDELFLINGETDSIYHLNALADALWGLAGTGAGEADMVNLLAAAFPSVAKNRIAGDVRALIESLTRRGLLVRRA